MLFHAYASAPPECIRSTQFVNVYDPDRNNVTLLEPLKIPVCVTALCGMRCRYPFVYMYVRNSVLCSHIVVMYWGQIV